VRDSAIVIPVTALRRIFVMLLVLIALILVVLVLRTQLFRAGISTLFAPSAADAIDHAAYQEIVLTNGSIYFGKLQPQGDEWFLLSDVFYPTSSEQNGTQLVKQGDEPQGPKDPMIIAKAQVLLIQNLRDDSQIVTLIKRFNSGQGPTQVPVSSAPAPATVSPASSTARPSATPTPTR
jgi:hypothetical protein